MGRELYDKDFRKKLREKYNKVRKILNSDSEILRVCACVALAEIGKADKSMQKRCVQSLFDFINSPLIYDDENGKTLDDLFPANKPLPPDIQKAIESFSSICKFYNNADFGNKQIYLLPYFWKNRWKGKISLVKANLEWGRNMAGASLRKSNLQKSNLYFANLREVDFSKANLRGANLRSASLYWANLHAADLSGVDLNNAHLTGANMREAKNLTKEQILSARWGHHVDGNNKPPRLHKDLIKDKKIKKWLSTPT